MGGLAAALTVVPVVLGVTAPPAGAVTVSTEEELRAAFADPAETSIVLANDIVLDDCAEGDVERRITDPLAPLTLDGAGFTITQTCPDGVLLTEGDLTLVNVTITGGNRQNGSGGGVAGPELSDASLVVRRSTITGNQATDGGSGGGIDWPAAGSVLIEDSTISDNFASDSGGGLRTFSDTIVVVRSTFSGNSVEDGAGGGIDASQGGPLTLVNSTIVANSAGEGGGGIAADDLALVYSTVTGNTAGAGANVAVIGDEDASAEFGSFASVIAEPQGGENCAFFFGVAPASAGYNFSDDTSCGLTAATDRQGAGDPQLGPLAANGGPTMTRLPAATSPLVDAIPVASCRDDGASDVTTDQRGVTRPQGSGCDIGAVELEQAPAPAPPSPIVLEPRFTG